MKQPHNFHMGVISRNHGLGFLTFSDLFCVVSCSAADDVRLWWRSWCRFCKPRIVLNCIELCRYGVWEWFQISLQAEVLLALFLFYLFFIPLNDTENSWIIASFSLTDGYMWLNFAADGGDSIIGGGHLDRLHHWYGMLVDLRIT